MINSDLFWCYKIVFGLVYVNLDDLFVLAPASTLEGINLSSTSAKPLTVFVPISLASELLEFSSPHCRF